MFKMSEDQVDVEECLVVRIFEILGDCWLLMIICDVFDGICCFGEFCYNFGLVKNILVGCLCNLVEYGILWVVFVFDGSVYYEYVLIEKGY